MDIKKGFLFSTKIFFNYCILLFIILIVLAFICSTFFLCTNKRIPINEIEDYSFFNTHFQDTTNSMLYDMSYSQLYFNNTLPSHFKNILQYKNFLDIGSGGGKASIHHLQNFFGLNTKIILSDLYPKVEQWKLIHNPNISYISENVHVDTLQKYLLPGYNMSLFGSLHHMEESTIHSLCKICSDRDTCLFIVEPRRYPFYIQYLHILSLPIIGLILYTMISLCSCGNILKNNILLALKRILTVPFFMTTDHIIGASRRYSLKEINDISYKNGLTVYHHCDLTFDYYIIKK